MTKPKKVVCQKIVAAKAAGLVMRAAIMAHMQKAGPQTAAEVHAAIGGDYEVVRASLYRMSKAGQLKSERGTDRLRNSIFRTSGYSTIARNVGKPYRPVLKEWVPNDKRDPLVSLLFGAPQI